VTSHTTGGAVPMRPLAVGEILDGAMSLLRLYPAATLGLGAAVMAVQMVLTVPVQWLTQDLTFSLLLPSPSGDGGIDPLLAILGFGISTLLVTLVSSVCSGVVSGMSAAVVGDAALGRPITAGTIWGQVRPRLWALIGLSLLITAATFGGLVVVLVGAVFMFVVTAVAIPALMLERTGVIGGFRRSLQLTMHTPSGFFRLLLIRGLALVVASVIGQVFVLPASAIGQAFIFGDNPNPSGGETLVAVFIVGLATFAASSVTVPFLGLVDALLYTDRRMRSEGLDIQLDQQARRVAAAREVA
jgi:hypothetical protein